MAAKIFASLLLVLSDVANSAPIGAEPNVSTIVTPPTGFTKVLFEDDFSTQVAGSLPSASKWTIDTGIGYPGGPSQWGTNEVQTYTNSPTNVAITANGTLRITPIVGRDGRWTSARIETTAANDFACAAGARLRMEASMRLGNAPASSQMGIWPAFWSLGSAYRGNYQNWPSVGEIDILESLNGAPTAWQTVHCGVASGGPCRETTGIGSTATLSRGEWHTVAVEIDRTNAGGDWSKETMTWLIDDRKVYTVSGATIGDQGAWVNVARSPKFLLLNVAIGGSFPDAIAKVKTPTSQTVGGADSAMDVKYVAVFST